MALQSKDFKVFLFFFKYFKVAFGFSKSNIFVCLFFIFNMSQLSEVRISFGEQYAGKKYTPTIPSSYADHEELISKKLLVKPTSMIFFFFITPFKIKNANMWSLDEVQCTITHLIVEG